MPINKGLMSPGRTDEWETPPDLFARLDAEFHFTLDACATAGNAKCPAFYSREDDGLSRPWRDVVFVNPPYGRAIPRWVEKAYLSSLAGATVVCLLPARTDTVWFHSYAARGEVRFLPGRVYFLNGGRRDRAPFPSMVVVFRPPAPTVFAPGRLAAGPISAMGEG